MKSLTHVRQSASSTIRRRPSYLHRLNGQKRVQVQQILRKPAIQTKLTIGAPDDVYEKEADRVADEVMRMPVGNERLQRLCPACDEELQRQPIEEEEEELQAKPAAGGLSSIDPQIESSIRALRGGGQPLPESECAFFEPRFGYDFSGVRIHTDQNAAETARAVNAQAFTLGRDVVFAQGRYAPHCDNGRRLLAHELTHVVQQTMRQKRTSNLQLPVGRGNFNAQIHRERSEIALQRSVSDNNLYEPKNQQILRWGSQGDAVVWLQKILNLAGAFPRLSEDGIFGPLTHRAVVAFQFDNELDTDGVVGPQTYKSLSGVSQSGSTVADAPHATGGGVGGQAKCRYAPGEADASRTSPGEYDIIAGPPTLDTLWNFASGSHALKPEHKAFISSLVNTYELSKPQSNNRVVRIVGYTDCVDTEAKNLQIRKERARSVWTGLIGKGAKLKYLSKPRAADPGKILYSNATPFGRAHNRAVVMQINRLPPSPIPPKPGEKPKTPPSTPSSRCGLSTDRYSKYWKLETIGVKVVSAAKGDVEVIFILKNRISGCYYDAIFKGRTTGTAAGIDFGILPGEEAFEVSSSKQPGSMSTTLGKTAEIRSVSLSAVIAGYSLACLWPHNDNLEWISIGGFSLGPSIPIGSFIAKGKFEVIRARSNSPKPEDQVLTSTPTPWCKTRPPL